MAGRLVCPGMGEATMRTRPTEIASAVARWVRLGVMLNAAPADSTPDLEVLLLDTARAASGHARLFILAASWLALYDEYVARHRLAQLIRDELEPEYRLTMGMLLDWAATHGQGHCCRFSRAIAACGRPKNGHPLLDIDSASPELARLAEEEASPLSKKWGLWFAPFDLKRDALRPVRWIAAKNPALAVRALTGGDLVASILAQGIHNPASLRSELDLAKQCGASRPAVREALSKLELSGYAHRTRVGHANAITLLSPWA